MPVTKKYSNPIILEDLKFNSLKINTDKDLIIGRSLFRNNTFYDEKIEKTILHYIIDVNKPLIKNTIDINHIDRNNIDKSHIDRNRIESHDV
tara:strand:- start:687 stop:962 length:276 start_codon:yes stop_codon:yes gene_type:complete